MSIFKVKLQRDKKWREALPSSRKRALFFLERLSFNSAQESSGDTWSHRPDSCHPKWLQGGGNLQCERGRLEGYLFLKRWRGRNSSAGLGGLTCKNHHGFYSLNSPCKGEPRTAASSIRRFTTFLHYSLKGGGCPQDPPPGQETQEERKEDHSMAANRPKQDAVWQPVAYPRATCVHGPDLV